MKIENVQRAATLSSALEGMKRSVAEAFAKKPESDDQDSFLYRKFQMAVGVPFATTSLSTPKFEAVVFVDMETGKLIAEAAERIIRNQLQTLGVDL